jgi:hypothetical protein
MRRVEGKCEMSDRTITPAAMALALVLTSSIVAAAAERLDLYDTKGRRTGYAVVDRDSGRVDYYDKHSRRTGYGNVDERGRVERFDLRGRRRDPSIVLPPPESRR